MQEVIRIFKEIQSTNSKNEKQSIIHKNADNELLKKCLIFLLDTRIITGISKKNINKDVLHISSNATLLNFEDVIEHLKINNTGSNSNIFDIQKFIKNQPEEHQEFYKQMITKSLRLGCDVKTVNKAIPNLIFTWEVQLGSSSEKLKLKVGEWFSLSQKLNGNRASFFHGNLISRQGKIFTGMQHIVEDLEKLNIKYFFDGELIHKNINGLSDGENFRIGTGIINSDAMVKDEIKFVIFDCFPEDEYKRNKQSEDNYAVRRNKLNSLRDEIKEKDLKNIEVVKMVYEGYDKAEINKWLDYAESHDWEGLMLNKNSAYKCKRTTDLIKIKKFHTMDLPIVDVVEGDGRLKGRLGALVVKYKNNTVNIGSGFNDNLRCQLWSKKEDIVGRVVEVKFKEVTKDKKTGLESLQFPVFVKLREVGKSVSYD